MGFWVDKIINEKPKPVLPPNQDVPKKFEGVAVVLARGQGIEKYNPEEWTHATKYGVNAIQMIHEIEHLVTIDDHLSLSLLNAEREFLTEDVKDRIRFTIKNGDKAKYWHHPDTEIARKMKCHVPLKLGSFKQVGVFNRDYVPSHKNTTFTAAALAARHGHKEIVLFGEHLYGHYYFDNGDRIKVMRSGYAMLKATLNYYGIDLYISHKESALYGILDIHPKLA